jgi:hypothetical protein
MSSKRLIINCKDEYAAMEFMFQLIKSRFTKKLHFWVDGGKNFIFLEDLDHEYVEEYMKDLFSVKTVPRGKI